MTAEPRIVVHPDEETLADAAGARLLLAIIDAQASHPGPVHLVLTGGTLGSAILSSLGRCPGTGAIDWQRLHLWWGDERYLPSGDPERNQTQNFAALFDSVPVADQNVHQVAGPDSAPSAEDAAQRYAAELGSAGPGDIPEFDIVLLGVGPDGHIASLFPGHPALSATGSTAAVHNSPKPPPDRVTLTFDTLRRGRRVWYLVAGAEKADAVRRGTGPRDVEATPASGVLGTHETLWLLDREAAADLPS